VAAAVTRRAVEDACRYADGWLAYRHRLDRIPGVQAAVVHDGDVVLSCAHGISDESTGDSLTTAHRFRVASHSKTFTATAALQLVQQGRLRLDDTAAHWLAYLRGGPLERVTLRELLSHSAGVLRDGEVADFWQVTDPFPDEAALVRATTAASAAVLARNERFKYSNVGFGLAGAIVAAAGGAPFAEQVRARIVDPLGLADTGVDLDDPPAAGPRGPLAGAHAALAYADRRVLVDQVATGALAPATGFVSTAHDVVRFFAAHFRGDDRLLDADAQRLMQRVEATGEPGDGSYGLGLMVDDVGGRRLYGHGGGWPGHISRTMFDPEARFAVTVCTNAIDAPAWAYATTLVKLIELAAEDAPAERVAADPATFAGRFATLWGAFDLVVLGGRVHLVNPAGPMPAGEAVALDVVDADTLRAERMSAYAAPGETIRVARDEGGAVVSLRTASGMTAYPFAVVAEAMRARRTVRAGDRLGPGALPWPPSRRRGATAAPSCSAASTCTAPRGSRSARRCARSCRRRRGRACASSTMPTPRRCGPSTRRTRTPTSSASRRSTTCGRVGACAMRSPMAPRSTTSSRRTCSSTCRTRWRSCRTSSRSCDPVAGSRWRCPTIATASTTRAR
jgi:CubicO group peptidase (beta-lactamase class C family)